MEAELAGVHRHNQEHERYNSFKQELDSMQLDINFQLNLKLRASHWVFPFGKQSSIFPTTANWSLLGC